ncbi:MAG: ATP-binding protein [Candidatus Marinarcus sp.]|uniref:PAS domain-containing sensor histidine kinase n=1 Tax=Candidatus Marinarcus sp. TaxID=3100987 RepID=UPI003B00F5F6
MNAKNDNLEDLKLFYALIDDSNEMIFITNMQTYQVTYANKIACKTLGYNLNDMRKLLVPQFRKPFNDEETYKQFLQKLENKKTLNAYTVLKTKNNEDIHVETSSKMVIIDGVKYNIAIVRNVQSWIEKEKIKDSILAQQTKMASMGEMIENITHQWKQPLSIISAMTTLLISKIKRKKIEETYLLDSLDTLKTTSEHMNKTIDSFKTFFNPSNKIVSISIKDLLSQAIELTGASLLANKITLVCKEPNASWYIHGIKNDLIQALINIINNAKDALKEQKNLTEKLIFIEVEAHKDDFTIEIKDNAGGIQGDMEKLFDSHYTTKANSGGTGIGLYMTKQIVQSHFNGDIVVKNKEYVYKKHKCKGASFLLKIPQN